MIILMKIKQVLYEKCKSFDFYDLNMLQSNEKKYSINARLKDIYNLQKQPSIDVLIKRFSRNME